MKTDKAILVVSFGTSYNDNRAKTIGAVEDLIREKYGGEWEIRRAFTSRMIIRKLKERDGEIIDYVTDAMQRLLDDGFRKVVVQPTHIMNGTEYDDVVRIVSGFSDRFENITIGRALLTSQDDYDDVVEAIKTDIIPDADGCIDGERAIVLVGHGTVHYANATYSQLQLKLMVDGLDDVYVTTVEGFPELDHTMEMMSGKGYTDVVLLPFMLVAGDHANNDIAGDDEDSFKTILEGKGYRVHCIVKGLGEYPEFRKLFLAHTDAAVSESTGQ